MVAASELNPQDGTVPGTVFTPRQVRLLKWVVIGLGVLLVVCFGLVIFGLVYQASNLGQATDAAVSEGGAAISAAAPMASLPVAKGQSVANMTINDDRLAVHLKGADGEEIVVVDLPSGRVLRRFVITPPR